MPRWADPLRLYRRRCKLRLPTLVVQIDTHGRMATPEGFLDQLLLAQGRRWIFQRTARDRHGKRPRGARRTLTLDQQLYADIKRVAQRENCTLFMTLLAAYAVLLHRFAGQQQIVIGTPALGRSLPGVR